MLGILEQEPVSRATIEEYQQAEESGVDPRCRLATGILEAELKR